jgi:hypothetical protein
LLSHPDWQSPKSWTGPNVMGSILTTVSRLLYLMEKTSNLENIKERQRLLCVSHESKYASSDSAWQEECANFINASLQTTEYAPPHIPTHEQLQLALNELPNLSPLRICSMEDSTANAGNSLIEMYDWNIFLIL